MVYKGGFKSVPDWVSIFEEVDNFDNNKIFNLSSKGLYIVKYLSWYFCFTFGHSKSLINQLAYERNFGLIVALNSADSESVKSIDKTNIGHIALHSRDQSSKEIDFREFGVDFDIDILKSITAKIDSNNKDGGSETISGRDSVSICTHVELASFSDIAGRLLTAFQDDKYKKKYPEFEYIQEVRDKSLLEKLDLTLVESIINKDFQKTWLAIPDIVEWPDIKGFSNRKKQLVSTKSGPVLQSDLDIASWVNECKIGDNLTIKSLKTKNVFLYWQDDRPPTPYKIYKCLNSEIELDGEKYILNDAAWYNIKKSYVAQIDQFYKNIPDSALTLPKYHAMKEPDYLKHVAESNKEFALMDRKNIDIGGRYSKVEFCDLYSANRDIIHVKKYGGSSLLSHLFKQALVSGECFLHEPQFREKLNQRLPEGFKLDNPQESPNPQDYRICLAVMSNADGPLELPFFSKVSIKYAVKQLKNMGFEVCKLKIDR